MIHMYEDSIWRPPRVYPWQKESFLTIPLPVTKEAFTVLYGLKKSVLDYDFGTLQVIRGVNING